MENVKHCCMFACTTNSTTDSKYLFGFPTDFNLCMSWVQNTGQPEYFEDFAFGGAQPFLNRYVCSDHFFEKDFIDAEDRSLGLEPGSVPNLNLSKSQIDIKEEYLDPEYAAAFHAISDIETPTEIKLEKSENDHYDDLSYNFSFSSNEESGNDLRRSKGPLSEKDAEEIKLSNDFFRDYNNAMKRSSKRRNESNKARLMRLKKEAMRAKERRSKETQEQTKIRRMKNALRAAFRRKNETPEQREARRIKDMVRAQMKRKSETETQARIRKHNDAVRAAHRRQNETEEERRERRMKDTLRAAKRRSMETPEQRELRLSKDRERASKKRLLRKIFEQMGLLNRTNDWVSTLQTTTDVIAETTECDSSSTTSFDSTPLTISTLSAIVGHCSETSNMERLQEVLHFIRKKVRAKPKPLRESESSDDSESFMAQDDTTNEDDNLYHTDDSQYQTNVINFLNWNKPHPQTVIEEKKPGGSVQHTHDSDSIEIDE